MNFAINKFTAVCLIATLLFLAACKPKPAQQNDLSVTPIGDQQLFELLGADQTGVDFNNTLTESQQYNHILQDVIFNGGGVAVVDINNDGLQDLYFAGNQVSDRLYLNKGNMKFEDITTKSGIFNKTWSTAIAIADVNNDGFKDIYVGKYLFEPEANRRNELYINNGDLTFTESAEQYGIADNRHCTAVNFFDYNKDGWLDLYVANQPYVANRLKEKKEEGSPEERAQYSDRLYKNNGQGGFIDVTAEAGITNYNYALSATVSDLNNDGWLDIYIACDYEEPDILYVNNGQGAFVKKTDFAFRHISNFSMGVDMADFNNDGLVDVYTGDMVASDNFRLKANMGGMNPEKFWNLAKAGYHYQYMFNTLQLNNGNGTFSEIGHLAGVSNTDWSWATIFGDYDNDGDKDLLVTNGLMKDIKNKDYIIKRQILLDSIYQATKDDSKVEYEQLASMAPSVKLKNSMFENKGNLAFDEASDKWGLGQKTWSHGAIYTDLDNDGDLDLVINNMNDPASIYENKSVDFKIGNWLRLKLLGDHGNNMDSYGARAWAYTKAGKQLLELSPVRGYQSSSEPFIHIGLGAETQVDRLVVQWLDGRRIDMENVPANQLITLDQKNAAPGQLEGLPNVPIVFGAHAKESGITYVHQENEFDDYKDQILLPHRMSRLGPSMAKADVNGDGLEDFYIGGPANWPGELYLQGANGHFVPSASKPWQADKASEDTGTLFFDADGDGDMDLYVASGGAEYADGAPQLRDRLYINDGKANFTKSSALPNNISVSGAAIAAGDYDGDGDLDLFVGGRQMPGLYGFPAKSYILQNEKGRFKDVTASVAPDLVKPGMVSSAVWADIDGDKDLDLALVGEWMPLSFYRNEGGKLTNITADLNNMDMTAGWWNKIVAADMDKDGDMDFVAGNLGLNIKYKASESKPFKVYVKDFDNNGTNDVYLGYYDKDGVCYPVRGRQCSSQQLPFVKKEFETYTAFASATIEEVLGSRAEGSVYHEAKMFESVYLENRGNGQFSIYKLPVQAQVAPIFGIECRDINRDGNMDIVAVGNFYEREVETARSDAGTGIVMLGDGKGNFTPMPTYQTGLFAILDARDLLILEDDSKRMIVLIANNNNGIQINREQRVVN